MNDSADYPSLIEKNVTQLRAYLQDAWPIPDERLFARRNYKEMLKNLSRRALAAGWEPDMIEPEFRELLKAFVQQNVEAEAYHRKGERVREYERGRADMHDAIRFGAFPDCFRPRAASAPPPFCSGFARPNMSRRCALRNGHLSIMGQHILPNIISAIVSQMPVSMATAILAETALSFLGAQRPLP